MSRKTPKPSPLGEILEKYFSRCGLKRRLAEQRILDSWKKIVGRGIAEQTQPLRIQNGVLQVRVSNSVWMQQLQFMKGMILKKVREETGAEDIEELRLFLGELTGGGEPEGNAERREDRGEKNDLLLTEKEKERVRVEVAGLADPEMRRIFESVFSRGLAAGKAARPRGKEEEE